MAEKTTQLQIRISPEQKEALRRRAEGQGQDMSSYVLARVLPSKGLRFEELLIALARGQAERHVLADLNDFLTALEAEELERAVGAAKPEGLSPFLSNYVAAMVEHAAHRAGVSPPPWTARVPPLAEPYFASDLGSLRLHLLQAAPVAFKRRNLFVDSTLGDRV